MSWGRQSGMLSYALPDGLVGNITGGDAVCRFCWGLGMHLVAKSDLSTKNPFCASYVVKSNSLVSVAALTHRP